jgi:hypothetical protein
VGLRAGKGEGGESRRRASKDFKGGERPMQGSRANTMSEPKPGEAGRLKDFKMPKKFESYVS